MAKRAKVAENEKDPAEREALRKIREANDAVGRAAEELICAKDHASDARKAYDAAVSNLRRAVEDSTLPLFDQEQVAADGEEKEEDAA